MRFGGNKTNVTYQDICLEELNRGMLEQSAGHLDIQQRHHDMLDLLRRVVFDPVLGCVPAQTAESMQTGEDKEEPFVSDELRVAFTADVEPEPTKESDKDEDKEDKDDVEMAPVYLMTMCQRQRRQKCHARLYHLVPPLTQQSSTPAWT